MTREERALADEFMRRGRAATADLPYPVAFWIDESRSVVLAQGEVWRGLTAHMATTCRTFDQIATDPQHALGYVLGYLDAVYGMHPDDGKR